MTHEMSKIALVTGATRGIGRETVRQLAQAGMHTLLAGRTHQAAVAEALKLHAEGLPVEAIQLDVTDADSVEAAYRTVVERHGRLDVLINNAGIVLDDTTLPSSAQAMETWRRTIETNAFAMVAVTRLFQPLILRSPAGRIVNVSSLLGSITLHSQPGSPVYGFTAPAYSVSKSAVNAWTVQLACELRDTSVKVNAVHPGYVRTDMNRGEGDLDVGEG